MITLHGFAASNYYNMVKHALLYKGISFQEDLIYGGGEEWLAISPVGKVPAITTEAGEHLSESSVICDFLEESYPQRPLYPASAAERALVRQMMKIAELYLELPSRRLIPYVFTGTEAPAELQDEVRATITRGIGALRRLAQFSPWIAGESFSMADIYVFYVYAVVDLAVAQLDWDIPGEIPGMKEWQAAMRDSDIGQQVEADRLANQPGFRAYVKARLEA